MSQRNPMNDRYQTDEHRGQTRKSAATMKPKSKAAATVRVQPAQKTKQQKKAEKKVERAKQSEIDRKYYNPPTQEYKRLRRLWWVLLVGAIVMVAASWLGRGVLPAPLTYVALGLAYVCIIAALYVDFSKIKKVRRRYAEEMESRKTKEVRAAEKQQKQAERLEAKKKGETAAEDTAAEETPKKRSLFGSGFRLKKAEESKAEKQASKQTKAEKKAGADSGQAAVAGDGETNEAFERAKADAKKATQNSKK